MRFLCVIVMNILRLYDENLAKQIPLEDQTLKNLYDDHPYQFFTTFCSEYKDRSIFKVYTPKKDDRDDNPNTVQSDRKIGYNTLCNRALEFIKKNFHTSLESERKDNALKGSYKPMSRSGVIEIFRSLKKTILSRPSDYNSIATQHLILQVFVCDNVLHYISSNSSDMYSVNSTAIHQIYVILDSIGRSCNLVTMLLAYKCISNGTNKLITQMKETPLETKKEYFEICFSLSANQIDDEIDFFFEFEPYNSLFALQILPNRRLVGFDYENIEYESEKKGRLGVNKKEGPERYGRFFFVMKNKGQKSSIFYKSIKLGPHTYECVGIHIFCDTVPIFYYPEYHKQNETHLYSSPDTNKNKISPDQVERLLSELEKNPMIVYFYERFEQDAYN